MVLALTAKGTHRHCQQAGDDEQGTNWGPAILRFHGDYLSADWLPFDANDTEFTARYTRAHFNRFRNAQTSRSLPEKQGHFKGGR
jgi:hypothetical protein